MADMSKLLVAGGLVILTGPLSFSAGAQDYVDVEAERTGRTAASQPQDPATASDPYARPPASAPYGVQPAQTYPATSYGLGNAPAGVAVAPPAGAVSAPAAVGGQNVGNLFLQLQQLQQEVMRLNGLVEEQANELRKLKDQSLERYVDLDKRLSAMTAGGAAATAAVAGSATSTPPPAAGISLGGGAEIPGEAEAYQAAYGLVRSQQFDAAVDAFRQFLRNYPDGKYAANAHYWLGELYLVVQPRDLEASRQAFSLLLSQYPDNAKAPDAMYKLGKVHFEKGNRDKAREYMDRVVTDYGNTSSSAVKLARDFLAENY
jgi:tol-pal system protein YbgF